MRAQRFVSASGALEGECSEVCTPVPHMFVIVITIIIIVVIIIIRRPLGAHGCETPGYKPLSIHLPRLQMQIQTSELSPSKAPDANAPFFNC